jgi:hypothetical protein
MATPSAAFLCPLLALLLWTPVGFRIACRLPIGRDLRLAATPILGWAVQDVSALHVSMLGGFTLANLVAATVLIGLVAFLAPASRPPEMPGSSLPMWIFVAAAVVAVGPAASILPKISAVGVVLADPIYDHAKIALVDEIVRTGVPPANPFVGTGDGTSGTPPTTIGPSRRHDPHRIRRRLLCSEPCAAPGDRNDRRRRPCGSRFA